VQRLTSSLAVVLPGEELATIYGRELAALERRGESISAMDLLIAATALAEGAPLVTRNRRHFERVRGLEILDY
jgi:tRNA(fMet)-specific endonuclease VapC